MGEDGRPDDTDDATDATDATDGDADRWTADVTLSDGGTVHVRPVRPDDAPLVAAFHARQSAESIYYRYFTARPELSERELERLTVVDYRDRFAFVALLGDDLVGIARYDRWPGRNEAEVAFFVDDAHHRRGIGILLLEYLAAVGREEGFRELTAQVLPTNRKMISVFQAVGYEVATTLEDGVIEVHLALEPTAESEAKIEARARASEARSVRRILSPTSVAVIGAGRTEGTHGHELVRELVAHEFQGPVYPVNPHATHVAGLPAHHSVLEIPDDVGLALVAVPADQVLAVVEQCARKRVQALAVVSAGFSDAGPSGAAVERALVRLAHRNGMRVVGPHTLGLVNTDPEVSLHALAIPGGPGPGPVGFLTQSATLGVAVLDRFAEEGIGISSFVSLGNKADLSANDLLRYWEDDERTDVAVLYVESLGNPRTFSRVARRLSRRKPLVVLRAGVSVTDTDEPVATTVLDQAGVITVDSVSGLLDVVRLLISAPLPSGDRVAVISSSGTPAALAADACQHHGLTLAGPPLRLPFTAGPADYEAAVRDAIADPEVDSVLVVLGPPAVGGGGRAHRPLPDLAGVARAPGSRTPVVVAFLGSAEQAREADHVGVPAFVEPGDAARALAGVTRYAHFLTHPVGEPPDFEDVDVEAATDVVAEVLGRDEGDDVSPSRVQRLLSAFGLEPVSRRIAFSADDSVEAAQALGYPVALKATGLPRLRHTEAGGVSLDLADADAVVGAHQRMQALLGDAMRPAVVQKMLPGGVDVAISLRQDPASGSVVECGLGGAVMGAVAPPMRALPITDVEAAALVASSAVAPLLADLDPTGQAASSVQELVLRLAALGEALPEVAEVVLNPVIVSVSSSPSAQVADATVRIAPYQPKPPPAIRRLAS